MICKWGACRKAVKTKERLIAHVKTVHFDPLAQFKPRPDSYNCEWRSCRGKRSFQVPYRCKDCNQEFRSTNDRAKHMKGVHRKEKRQCGYQGCKKAYSATSSIRKHVEKVHGTEVWEIFKKKDCGSKDRESSHGPDSGGHLPENPGLTETSNVANANEGPINGPELSGYLTADVEKEGKLDVIEMGLSEVRRDNNHTVHQFVNGMSEEAKIQLQKVSALLTQPNLSDETLLEKIAQFYVKIPIEIRKEFEKNWHNLVEDKR
ncbi:unnamed protein product, partial [Mesorhabditis belari]|uniref:C2H2-type domain-containing protein n=1 Tax=Mesorhabditis belari TaxID=2138241 RepID=A0AAF3J896_9BILA